MKLAIVLFATIIISSCFPNYSNGTRVGVVTKLSEKGFIFKSWEGEMLMALPSGVSAISPEKFRFTVEPEVASNVQEAMRSGKRVELHYHQWGVSPPTMGTDYSVDAVSPVE